MAVKKDLQSSALVIETENGTDKNGNPVYTKKSFSNVKRDCDVEKVFATAEAIKTVLANGATAYYLRDLSTLISE